MEIVPKSTTIETAIAVLCSCALSTGSVARTAAAPQTDAPAAVNIDVSLSILKIFVPNQIPIIIVVDNIKNETIKP